jgi:hypothetical protein
VLSSRLKGVDSTGLFNIEFIVRVPIEDVLSLDEDKPLADSLSSVFPVF